MSLTLSDPAAMMWGSELILRDGAPAGQVTSAAWGDTVGAAVGLGYVADPAGLPVTPSFISNATYHVSVAGQLVPAQVSLRPPLVRRGSQP